MPFIEYLSRVFKAVLNIPEEIQEKPQRKRIPKKLREEVWIKYNKDSETGICYCCRNIVQRRKYGWHCSHVNPVCKGGEDILSNLRVCCSDCNLKMGSQNMYEYMKKQNK